MRLLLPVNVTVGETEFVKEPVPERDPEPLTLTEKLIVALEVELGQYEPEFVKDEVTEIEADPESDCAPTNPTFEAKARKRSGMYWNITEVKKNINNSTEDGSDIEESMGKKRFV